MKYLSSFFLSIIIALAATPLYAQDVEDEAEFYFDTENTEDADAIGTETSTSILNTGLAVGTPNGEFAISPLGGATYTIPIDIPQGLHGMQPQISLTYNSQSGNGVAGWGCNLTGVSAITRGPQDIYHDGVAHGTEYYNDSVFYLDGQRLIQLERTAGSDSIVFCLEADPYTRVVSHASNNSWTFIVYTPDGLKYTYGGLYYEQNVYTSGVFVNAWYLKEVENSLGYYIRYSYFETGSYKYLEKIEYGDNQTISSPTRNKVLFTYENRPDTQGFPLKYAKGSMSKRLKTIESSTNGTLYRKYELAYDNQGDGTAFKYSRLVSVTESNASGESLNPIALQWTNLPTFSTSTGDLSVTLNESSSYCEFMDGFDLTAADYNGDGISDIVQHAQVKQLVSGGNGYASYTYHNDYYIYRSIIDGSGNISFGSPILYRFKSNGLFADWKNGVNPIANVDIDGDGLTDMIVPFMVQDVNYGVIFYCVLGSYIAAGNVSGCPVRYYLLRHSQEHAKYTFADFDNNGCCDIAVLESKGNGNKYDLHIFKNSPQIISDTTSLHTTLTLSYPPKEIFTSDYNGDGMQDILVVMNEGYKIFWNTGDGLTSNTFSDSQSQTGISLSSMHILREGDFNGDGIVDFLTNDENSGQWYIHSGNGDGTFTSTLACTLDIHEQSGTGKDDKDFTCLVYDINGDSKSDVVISKAMFKKHSPLIGSSYYRFEKTKTYWMVSNGTTLTQLAASTSNKEENSQPNYYIVGDFDGNGQAELAHYGYNCYNATDANVDSELYVFSNNNWQNGTGKVGTITNGLGTATQVSYKPMTDRSVYKKTNSGYTNTAPLLTITPSMSVVSQVTAGNGSADNMVTNYTYKDLKYHNRGRGLLGFNSTTANNQTTGTQTTTTITRNNLTLLPEKVTTQQTVGGTTATTTNTYLSRYYHNTKALYSTLQSTVEVDLDNNTTTTTFTNDSTRNNVPLTTVVLGFDGAKVTTAYSNYVQRGNLYLPQTVTETRKHPDHSTNFVTTTTYEYNTKGLKTKEVAHAGTSKALTTNYTYDSWGNLTQTSTTGSDIETVTKLFEYDNSHRFMTKQTERGYLKTAYTYNAWGQVLTETDQTQSAHPKTTAYTYDGWGNLASTVSPTGLTTTRALGWDNSQAIRYFIYEQTTGKPWVKTWYDALGRKKRVQTIGPKGLSLNHYINYNAKGQTIQDVNVRGTSSYVKFFTYDTQGRLLTAADNCGKSQAFKYGANSVTTIDNGRQYTKTYDSWGNVKTSSDPVASVTYKYHSCGKPKSAASAGSTVTMAYDAVGNQSSLVDPDAGTMSYTYDALGRIKTQTDGNGIVTTHTYNSLGQLTQKMIGSTPIYYTYGQTTSNYGLLTSMSRGTLTESYQYDSFNRVTQETRTFESLSRSLGYSYDSIGNITSRSFPDQLQVNYEYDSYGNLDKMTSGSNVLYQLQAFSAQSTSEKLGNSLVRTRSFDLTGRLTASSTSITNSSTAAIAPQNYTYNNATGNLTSRTIGSGATENFTYDNLDRLTRVEVDNGPETYVIYDTNGNIDVKHGTGHQIGSYYYNSSRPHAVTDIENPYGPVDIPSSQVSVTYNELGKASQIYGSNAASLWYVYGPDEQRWRSTNFLYFGDYEERYVNDSNRRSFVYLDGGVLAVSNNGGAYQFYYIHTDHLGSIIAITDAQGNYVFKASYDAWGRQSVEQNTLGFHRGYTGHEMLAAGGLVNMNGRIYDPAIGLFLSPDNYVQEPFNSQNFNRYSYCLNNPLKYTDPSGEAFGIDDVLFVAAMAYFGGIQANFGNSVEHSSNPFNPLNWNWKSFGTYFGIGSGGLNGLSYTNVKFNLNISGIITNGSLHATAAVTFNGVTNITENRPFFSGAGWSALMGFIDGAIGGYYTADAKGKNYWWGGNVKYNRTKWSFYNVPKEDYRIIVYNGEAITKIDNDCVVATLTEANSVLGVPCDYNCCLSKVNLKEHGVEMSATQVENLLMDNYQNVENITKRAYNLFDPKYMREIAESGAVIVFHFGSPGHADIVRSLKVFNGEPYLNKLTFRNNYFNINSLEINNKHSVRGIWKVW